MSYVSVNESGRLERNQYNDFLPRRPLFLFTLYNYEDTYSKDKTT